MRSSLRKKMGDISDRHLNRLIKQHEIHTLLPRRLAILSLANDNGIAIRSHVTNDELAQLRAIKHGVAQPAQSSDQVSFRPSVSPGKQGSGKQGVRKQTTPAAAKPTKAKKVWIAYGRNLHMRQQLAIFLRSLGLEVVEWNKLLAAAGKGTPSIYEDVLTAAFREAAVAVILLTPDDEVMLNEQFWKKSSDEAYEHVRVGQARPNVIFEAGLAMGRNANATVLVQVGNVKPFSDTRGLHVAHVTNSADSRRQLATKLATAGCAVDDSGTDWLHDGDFTL